MFMKHYAPDRCEPSIESLNFEGGGGVRVDVNGEVKIFENSEKNIGGGGGGVGSGGRLGGRVDVNGEVKFL